MATATVGTLEKLTAKQAFYQADSRAKALYPKILAFAFRTSNLKGAPANVVALGTKAQLLKKELLTWLVRYFGPYKELTDGSIVFTVKGYVSVWLVESRGTVILQEVMTLENKFYALCSEYQKLGDTLVAGCEEPYKLAVPRTPKSWVDFAENALWAGTICYVAYLVVPPIIRYVEK